MSQAGRPLAILALVAAASVPAAGTSPPEAVEALSAGQPHERRLAREETHRYGLDLAAGDYARVTVRQQGVDVVVATLAPDGSPLVEADGPTGRSGDEAVSLVARAAGRYVVEVRGLEAGPAGGSYRVEVTALRPATLEDERRTRAEHATALGSQRYGRGTPEEVTAAVKAYEEALAIARELGEPGFEGTVRFRLGQALLRQGDRPAAMAQSERALALARQAGDGGTALLALNQMGRLHRMAGEPARALAAFSEALALCEQHGGPAEAAPVLNNIGVLHHQSGRLQEALPSYARALELYRQEGDLAGEANVLGSLGSLLASLGRTDEALARLERALVVSRQLGRRSLEANVLNNLGDLYRAVWQTRRAVEAFASSLEIYRQLGDKPQQAAVLNNLGGVLADLGAGAEGKAFLLEALPLHADPRLAARTRTNLARAELVLDRPDEAVRWLEQAGASYRELQDRGGEAQVLFFTGFIHLRASRPREAEPLVTSALALFREVGDPFWEGVALRLLGQVQAALGSQEAAASFAASLRLATARGDEREQGRVLWERARWSLQRGDLDGARQDLDTAVAKLESLRAEVSGERLRSSFLASVGEIYSLQVELLMRLHDARPGDGFEARALAAAERSRSRALLDVLARSEVEVREGDPGLLAEERRLRQELAAKAARRMSLPLSGEAAKETAALEREIESLAAAHRLTEARLRAADPRHAALRDPGIDLAAIQRLLGEETALLEYSLGDSRSWLWVVTPSALSVFELPGRERLEELARQVHRHLRAPAAGGAASRREDLAELSRLLLGPALAGLEGKRLAVVADGALRAVPFATLPVPAEGGGSVPLVLRHEVVHLPSAAVLREIRRAAAGRPRPTGDLAVFADPVYDGADPRLRLAGKTPAGPPPGERLASTLADPRAAAATDLLRSLTGAGRSVPLTRLAWSRREAEAITAAAAGRNLLLALDFRASRDLALSPEMARYQILHFAAHGILEEDHPELSGLALSQWDEEARQRDGFLRLQDIYGLDLQAGVVVLSGCKTALGRHIHGEGFLGLTYGFLHAGASQVVASLWNVRDRATAELMERFYRSLYRDGLRPAAALRRAQAEMWSQGTWRDPYYWGAFILQGDWQAPAR